MADVINPATVMMYSRGSEGDSWFQGTRQSDALWTSVASSISDYTGKAILRGFPCSEFLETYAEWHLLLISPDTSERVCGNYYKSLLRAAC